MSDNRQTTYRFLQGLLGLWCVRQVFLLCGGFTSILYSCISEVATFFVLSLLFSLVSPLLICYLRFTFDSLQLKSLPFLASYFVLTPLVINYNPKDENYDFVYTAILRNMPVVIRHLDNFEASRNILNREQLVALLQSETIHDVRGSKNASFMYYSYNFLFFISNSFF